MNPVGNATIECELLRKNNIVKSNPFLMNESHPHCIPKDATNFNASNPGKKNPFLQDSIDSLSMYNKKLLKSSSGSTKNSSFFSSYSNGSEKTVNQPYWYSDSHLEEKCDSDSIITLTDNLSKDKGSLSDTTGTDQEESTPEFTNEIKHEKPELSESSLEILELSNSSLNLNDYIPESDISHQADLPFPKDALQNHDSLADQDDELMNNEAEEKMADESESIENEINREIPKLKDLSIGTLDPIVNSNDFSNFDFEIPLLDSDNFIDEKKELFFSNQEGLNTDQEGLNTDQEGLNTDQEGLNTADIAELNMTDQADSEENNTIQDKEHLGINSPDQEDTDLIIDTLEKNNSDFNFEADFARLEFKPLDLDYEDLSIGLSFDENELSLQAPEKIPHALDAEKDTEIIFNAKKDTEINSITGHNTFTGSEKEKECIDVDFDFLSFGNVWESEIFTKPIIESNIQRPELIVDCCIEKTKSNENLLDLSQMNHDVESTVKKNDSVADVGNLKSKHVSFRSAWKGELEAIHYINHDENISYKDGSVGVVILQCIFLEALNIVDVLEMKKIDNRKDKTLRLLISCNDFTQYSRAVFIPAGHSKTHIGYEHSTGISKSSNIYVKLLELKEVTKNPAIFKLFDSLKRGTDELFKKTDSMVSITSPDQSDEPEWGIVAQGKFTADLVFTNVKSTQDYCLDLNGEKSLMASIQVRYFYAPFYGHPQDCVMPSSFAEIDQDINLSESHQRIFKSGYMFQKGGDFDVILYNLILVRIGKRDIIC
jgi:hypothetical protein